MSTTSRTTSSRILDAVSKDARGLVGRLQKLQEIGTALSAEQDLAKLLHLILKHSRELTGADSGSIYIRQDDVEIVPDATARDEITRRTPYLVLKVTQNDSITFPFKEMRLRFDPKTIAGYVATSGELVNLIDAYNLPEHVSYSYNRGFDEASGYRCKSMLVVPMRNRDGDIIGVIQLINKKRDEAERLRSKEDVDRAVTIFDVFDEELALSLASQAAVCIEKTNLYSDIERMFEGLVNSFTLALEHRNRTTYGHCLRVAKYAIAIAEAVNAEPPERFGGVRFSEEQLKELRYAALLHDIGKIAVPEAVLDKQNKLTDDQLRSIVYRCHYWKQRLAAEGKLTPERAAELDAWLEAVRRANIPRGLSEEDARHLEAMKSARFADVDGTEKPLLTDLEHENLSIRRGNLTTAERKAIEKHIVDTWEMLRRVPWPRFVGRVANIAACHHEKINGSGYPWGFKAPDIPFGGKILAIVDIFEALTAKDRPYKPAIPVEKALAILDDEVARGNLDPDLYRLFKERRIYSLFATDTGFVARPAEPQLPA